MRKAIREALALASKGIDKIVLELPTGYGKTAAGPRLYKTYREAGLCWRAIHVFPLRAVLHKTLERYTRSNYGIEFVYQDGDVTLTERGYVKDPYFRGEYVLTTIDSFVHNLLKAPVVELHKLLSYKSRAIHYHQPLAHIYPSCVFVDEAHVAIRGETGKTAAALRVALEALKSAEVPIVIMSATLGKWKKEFFNGYTFVELGKHDKHESERVVVEDKEFEAIFKETRYQVDVVDEEEIAKLARRKAEEGRRVLVVVNNVRRAMELARELNAVLIHSMLTRRDRRSAEDELENARIVVGTSAIEAGVDVSFDVLISSADSAESVVQRVGRICRYGGNCSGEIYLFGDGAKRFVDIHEWRLPYRDNSYVELLDDKIEEDRGISWLLREIAQKIYIEADELKKIFKKAGASFVRSALIEVCTEENCALEDSFAISLDRVKQIEPSKVVAGSCRKEPPTKYDVNWLIEVVNECGSLPKLYVENYVKGYGPLLK